MASARQRRLGRLLRAGLAVLLAAAASETALRVAGRLYLGRLYTTAHRALEPDPADINVLCLGESSTAGLGVEPAESYPARLEALLRDFYDRPRIRTLVPPHVGQNTSQMANRVTDYLERYAPRLVVLMAGFNNEWSLAESHVTRHLEGSWAQTWRPRALVFLDGFRLFKLLRYTYLRLAARERSSYMAENRHYLWGHPELVRLPPAQWVHEFAREQRAAFVRAWREDVATIVRESRARGARVLLMTYHLNPSYLPEQSFVSLARELDVPLVRNDLAFRALRGRSGGERYLLADAWHPAAALYAEIARSAFEVIWSENLLSLSAAREPRPGAHFSGSRLALGTVAAESYLGHGWSGPESGPGGWFRWTDAERAELFLDLSPKRRVVRLRFDPFLERDALPRQRVNLLVGDRPVARWSLADTPTRVLSLVVPEAAASRATTLTLLLPDARSPRQLGLSDDARRLGLAVEWLALEDFPAEPLGRRLQLRSEATEAYLGSGWTAAEDGMRWMQAPRAELIFRAADNGPRTLRLKVRALRPHALNAPPLALELNGWRLPPFRVSATDVLPAAYSVSLPSGGLEARNVLAFEWPAAGPLVELPEPPGLAIEWLELAR